jgi:hypothetical protein
LKGPPTMKGSCVLLYLPYGTAALLSPHDPYKTDQLKGPYRKLLVAMLERAVLDYLYEGPPTGNMPQKFTRCAKDWIEHEAEGDYEPFSLEYVSEHLGICPKYLRKTLMSLKAEQLSPEAVKKMRGI